MTPDELRHKEALRWLEIAARDLRAAGILVPVEPSVAVFHCQQAAEKSAKGFLVLHEVVFRKTHDLRELGTQCAEIDASLASLLKEAANLTDYAVVFRYLDAPHAADEAEAAQALDTARRLYDRIRALVETPAA